MFVACSSKGSCRYGHFQLRHQRVEFDAERGKRILIIVVILVVVVVVVIVVGVGVCGGVVGKEFCSWRVPIPVWMDSMGESA